jgi:hypothetical protein
MDVVVEIGAGGIGRAGDAVALARGAIGAKTDQQAAGDEEAAAREDGHQLSS